MALSVEQLNEPPPGTYWHMLYKSQDSLAPFHTNSTPQEMGKILRELHQQEISQGNNTSKTIETLLKKRKIRLKKMIAYIDVEISPRKLERQFMSDLCDDFGNHINTIILLLPAPVYVGNWNTLKIHLTSALSALRSALDALEAMEREKKAAQKISTIKSLYRALLEATTHCDEGLSNWDTPLSDQSDTEDAEEKENLPQDDPGRELQEQLEIIEAIYYPLMSVGSKLLQERELEDFEGQLRIPVLKTLLTLAAQKMPDDEESRKRISSSAIHTYIRYKSEIIQNLRLAKFALNLSLSRYQLIKPPARVQRKDLEQDRIDCYMSLDAAMQRLKEKQ